MKTISIGLLIFVVVACNRSNYIPSGILKPRQMESIFWDMVRGDILAQETVKKDTALTIKSAGFSITEKIFAIHHTDRSKFKKSLVFYERHPVLLKTIFDSLNARQTRAKVSVEDKRIKYLKNYHLPDSNKIP